MKKRMLLLVLSFLFLTGSAFSCYAEGDWTSEYTKAGTLFSFGHFEQDNRTSNGKEPIQWIVLARDGNKILCISLDILDYRQYTGSYSSYTEYERSDIKNWLEDDFFHTAFSGDERSAIQEISLLAV